MSNMADSDRNWRLFLHAPNIHSGGGAVLLRALLEEMPSEVSGHLVVDARFDGLDRLPANWTVQTVAPRIASRLGAEWSLRGASAKCDRVLCFGNLPPLFGAAKPVTVFVQNRNLLPGADLSGFSRRIRLNHLLEWTWLRLRRRQVCEFIVQTESMKQSLQLALGPDVSIRIEPFTPTIKPLALHPDPAPRYDFIYVASGDPHKNHRTLIEAWEILAKQGHYPRLLLTLEPDTHSALWLWIQERITRARLNIANRAGLTHAETLEAYRQSRCLIFPSYSESLGLPLLEAAQLGIPTLASELDSVRDIAAPKETFNPRSPISISRAVCRFMGWGGNGPASVLGAREWISTLPSQVSVAGSR